MKWYFASRVKHKENLQQVSSFLIKHNQIVSSTWIYENSIKPYDQNTKKVRELCKDVVKSLIEKTDIFVLISDEAGTDMFVELGIALAKKQTKNKLFIYIVGKHSKRSLMQLHPDIKHVGNIKRILEIEGVGTKKFPKVSFK